jgi:hypothetical protein
MSEWASGRVGESANGAKGFRPILLVVLLLLVGGVACGVGGTVAHRHNDIRRVALAHEVAARGAANELLVAFSFVQVRDNLGFEGGNTVWLNPVARGEYSRHRDVDKSYIFLHPPSEDEGIVSIVVDRGDASGVQSRQLTLERKEGAWVVVSEQPVTSRTSAIDHLNGV